MSLTEYVSIVKNPYVNIEGFDKSNCCRSLMLNGFGDWYCEENHESVGYGNEGTLKAMMYCQFYYRDHNCWLDIKKKAEKERAEKERAEREKAEAEERALFEKIISDFTKSIQANPNDAETYYLRGGAYTQRKEYKKAMDDFNEAIRLDPNNAEFYAFRGATYTEQNEYEQAITDFNDAIRINPNCKNAFCFRAAMYGAKEEHDKSISDFEEALRIDPKDNITASLLENARKLKAEAERRQKEEKKQLFMNKFRIVLGGIAGGLAFAFFASVANSTLFRIVFTVLIFIIAFRHKSNNVNDGFFWFLGYVAISLIGAIGILALLTVLPFIVSIIIGIIAGALIGKFFLNIKRSLFD